MEAAERRLCPSCLVPREIDQFRVRSRSGGRRMRQCRECHNAAERRRRAGSRDARLAGALTRLQGERSHKRVAAICDAMLAEFGGIAGFVEAWRDYYRRSLEQGGLGAIRSFQAYLRLVRFCEHHQRR